MDVLREEVTQAFDGPLAEVAGLPTGILYAVVLTLTHVGGRKALGAVVDALRPMLGAPARLSEGWLAGQATYTGSMPAQLKVGKSQVRLAVGRRLRSQRVEDLVHALAAVPGASDLRLTAERRVFQEPGANAGTPME